MHTSRRILPEIEWYHLILLAVSCEIILHHDIIFRMKSFFQGETYPRQFTSIGPNINKLFKIKKYFFDKHTLYQLLVWKLRLIGVA